MKIFRKKIGAYLLLFLAVVALFVGCGGEKKEKNGFRIVTSFYPMYVMMLNVAGDVDGVDVANMAAPAAGCLHDYQLTTADMELLSDADVLVTNGGGMENFLDKVTDSCPNLKIINASDNDKTVFLKGLEGDNPHVWMSVTYAIAETKAVTSALSEIDPAHADAYRKNALDYVMKLDALRSELHEKLDNLPHKDIVTFHEAFDYFAREFKLNVAAIIAREPGTEPTPEEMNDTVDKVNALDVKVLFTEPQYPAKTAETIARETGAKIYSLNPVVTGELGDKDAYLKAMRKNADTLSEALK